MTQDELGKLINEKVLEFERQNYGMEIQSLRKETLELCGDVARHSISSFVNESDSELSPRQREVAKLVIEGKTDREIAGLLSVSITTVKTHGKAIRAKLHAKNRTQIASMKEV